MTEKSLIKRDPETLIQRAEDWASMPTDAIKRRAATASQNDDRDELRSLLDAYVLLSGRKKSRTSQNTLNTYWRGAVHFLDWCGATGIKPHQAEVIHAQRFVVSMGTLAPKSAQVYLTGARSMFGALKWGGLGTGNPFAGIGIEDPTPDAQKADPYTHEEIAQLLESSNDRERAIVLLAADGGLRVAEIANLKWTNVDFERRQLRGFTGKGGQQATIEATNRLMESLQVLRGRDPRSGVIFGISRRRVQQLIERLCERAGVNHRGIHSLRHSAGSRLFAATGSQRIVQEHLRHKNIETTGIYVMLGDQALRDAIDRMEEMNGS